MSVELVLEDLKKQFGDRKVLYARDIATILGQSPDMARRLMNSNSLPLKLIEVGGHRGVSIYEMAQWLSTGEHQGSALGHQPVVSAGRRRTVARPSKHLPRPYEGAAVSGRTEIEGGTSLVAKIISMRHDAASFIVDQVSSSKELTSNERHFWWSVIGNLDMDQGDVPALLLKVVRVTLPSEQTTTLRAYDLHELERVRDDIRAMLSDPASTVVRITLKNQPTQSTLVKAIRHGEKRLFLIDRLGLSDSAHACSS